VQSRLAKGKDFGDFARFNNGLSEINQTGIAPN
jgi:hypothetical protein